jgi:hypothetical protein
MNPAKRVRSPPPGSLLDPNRPSCTDHSEPRLNVAADAADASRAMLRTSCPSATHRIAVLAHAHFLSTAKPIAYRWGMRKLAPTAVEELLEIVMRCGRRSSPHTGTGTPDQQPHRLAAVAESQHEQARPAVFAALRIAHQRTDP